MADPNTAAEVADIVFILTCDFSSADVAQALLPAGAETLLGAGEPRSPNACPACARPRFSHKSYHPTVVVFILTSDS